MDKNLIGIREMAKKLDVHASWLYQRTRKNEVPHYRLGKYVKFNESEVMLWIKKNSDEIE
jgi:excisionase family DNA binding protein